MCRCPSWQLEKEPASHLTVMAHSALEMTFRNMSFMVGSDLSLKVYFKNTQKSLGDKDRQNGGGGVCDQVWLCGLGDSESKRKKKK